MNTYENSDIVNVGVGNDVSIRELAESIQKVVGFDGTLEFDSTKPDGTPRKLMNVDRLTNIGWTAKISLDEGIQSTYDWFLENVTGICV